MAKEISFTVFKLKGRTFYQVQWKDPVTGKKVTRSTGERYKKAAERKAAVIMQDAAKRVDRPERITWADFRERYETEVVLSMAKNSGLKIDAMFNSVERIINPEYLDAMTASQISRYQSAMRSEKLAEASIKSHLAHLKAAIRWAHSLDLLETVPRIVMPKRTAAKMKGRPITAEEFERMLAKVESVVGVAATDSWKFLLRGLWWSGLRLGEALELHWTDQRRLCVDTSGKRPMFRIQAEAEKGNKFRLLPMAPELFEMLMTFPDAERSGYVFTPASQRPNSGRLRLDRVSRVICQIGERSGVKVGERTKRRRKPKKGEKRTETVPRFASAHDLRRAFGFRWSQRVMPNVLQLMMRHEKIETTMEYYVGRNADAAADAMWDAVSGGVTNTFTNTSPDLADSDDGGNAKSPAKQGFFK